MKKLKIKKCMTSFLMLAVMVVSIIGVIPKTIAYADDDVEIKDYTFGICSADNPDTDMSLEKFAVQESAWRNVAFVNLEKGQYVVASIVKGVSIDNTIHKYRYLSKGDSTYLYDESSYRGTIANYTYNNTDYCFVVRYGTYSPSSYVFKANKCMCFTTTENVASSPSTWIRDFIGDALPTTFTQVSDQGMDSSKIPNGSQDNPYEDKDIGTIVLKSHGFISTKNDQFIGDVSCSYDYYFKYKDKTSSGFSLTDNKYARTFIEVKVQNQCVLYNKDNEDIIEEYYPHYGEYYTYKRFPLESIDNNTLRVGWGDIYSKWNDYSEHPVATNKKLAYRFMVRVVCTDSLTVIPDEKSGWYAGGWRSILFDGSKFVEETNGHVDNDGNWKDDKDDGHNNSSDKTSHNNESKNDVDKIMNDDSDSSAGSSGVAGIKSFLKDVGNVPKAIGKLFSFLPSWCTDFIAFGFVVLVALMIIKAIRG